MNLEGLRQDWAFACNTAEACLDALFKRVMILEQQVANQALELQKLRVPAGTVYGPIELKSQAAQQQAENHLYAPLRNDTRAVIDMAAFVRKVAAMTAPEHASYTLISEAQEILKRST